jgi:hypothetical protein
MTFSGAVSLTGNVTLSTGNSQTFTHASSVQSFTVPTGVTSITARLTGAGGGRGGNDGGNTGGGTGVAGSVTANFAVTSGSIVYLAAHKGLIRVAVLAEA